jgi:protein O-GlcNAc transferase
MNEAVLQNAMRLRREGRLAEAAQIYADILRAEPHHFEALHALGIVRYQAGQLQEAERLIAQATVVNPQAAEAQYNRGSLLLKLNRLEEALSCFGQALAVRPDYVEALGNRGNTLRRLGRFGAACADFEAVVTLRPRLAEAWNNLGAVLMMLDRYEDALESFGKALAIRPDYPEARRSLGSVLFKLKNYDAALGAADIALGFNQNNGDAWEQRADALNELKRHEEALASYARVLELRPDAVDALYNRGNLLMGMRRFEEAARDYASVLRLNPDYHYALGNVAFCRLGICDWSDFEATTGSVTAGLAAGKPVSPPFQALAAGADAPCAFTAATLWTKHGYSASSGPLWRGEIYRHERIRIAYLSANFHDHAVARLITGVFEHHDRTRFETIGVSFGPDDQGALRARVKNAFEHFVDVRTELPAQIATVLREHEVDIAIDLMGYTEASRPAILSFRPAPLQVNYLGYPGTMGGDYINYIIADPTVIPREERPCFSEQVVYLPYCYLPSDNRRAIAPVPSRAQAGLPETGFVFCCFNNNFKFTPQIFDVWLRLLRACKGSVLWLSQANETAIANLRQCAEENNVAPEQLVFAPFVRRDEDHLARLALADLFLDTVPYNAHATASDALWAGVPVLTLAGPNFPGRVGTSLAHAIGMPEMIASDLRAYEVRALAFAQDPSRLVAAKSKLAHNRVTQPLFDTAQYTRSLEDAYRSMWTRWQDGLLPESFSVECAP